MISIRHKRRYMYFRNPAWQLMRGDFVILRVMRHRITVGVVKKKIGLLRLNFLQGSLFFTAHVSYPLTMSKNVEERDSARASVFLESNS